MIEKGELTRAFICIDFSPLVIKEIAGIQKEIGKIKFHGKITEAENLHLTLKFLGEIDSETLEKIKARLREIKFSEFEAKLGKIGLFNYLGQPRIIWMKINGKDIFKVQKMIDLKLKDTLEQEERFMSHLTLARIKYVPNKRMFFRKIKNIKIDENSFKINEFKLKSSGLGRFGPIYSTIEEYKYR